MLLSALALFTPTALADAPAGADLWARFLAHRDDSGTLLAAQADAHGPTCLTGLVRELRDGLGTLSVEQQAEVLATIEPWRQRWAATGAPPPVSCVGSYGEHSVSDVHFTVEWDGNTISESTARAFLESLEYSWDVEVDELDWTGPQGATSKPILVYVQSGNYAGAYTSLQECSEGSYRYMPYIVAYSGSFSAGSWYKTMAAHEFNHATQFYYGYGHEFYWWEATATWVEEYVYPDLNDWADPIYYGYSSQPHIAFNASDQQNQDVFWHMYAMAVWAKYLDQYVGGHDLVQDTWEAASAYPSAIYNLWMPDIMEDLGYDFDVLYPEFMAALAFMDFDEPDYFLQPRTADTVESLPAEGEGDRDLPQSLGQNFISFDKDVYVEGASLRVTFNGSDSADRWYAVLARGDERTLDTYVTFELDDTGKGTAEIEMVSGAEYFLIVSPVDEGAVGMNYSWSRADDFGYSWSAEAFTPTAGGGDKSGDGKTGVCGYISAPSAALGWLAPLLVLGLRRRRLTAPQA